MRFLKGFLWLFVLALAIGGGYYYVSHTGPCKEPILYAIGTFDATFGISRSEFLAAAKQAENIWEKSLGGKNLFDYKIGGRLPINLIYDTRQQTVDKNATLETKISATEVSADAVKQQFLALQTEYEQSKQEYTALVDGFAQKGRDYSAEVDYWNSRGGANRAEYDKLNEEKQNLVAEQAALDSKRITLNELAGEVNAMVQKYNFLVRDVNSNIAEINKSADKDFEQGEYIYDKDGPRIDIFEYQASADLVRVLAHEFGHAIGLDHNANPKSIMYYLNSATGLVPSAEDVAALKMACNIK